MSVSISVCGLYFRCGFYLEMIRTFLFFVLLIAIISPLDSYANFEGEEDKVDAADDGNSGMYRDLEAIDFQAHRIGDVVELKWITSGIVEDFLIERSLDGDDWLEVLSMKGPLSSSYVIEYMDFDFEVPSAKLFYRVKKKKQTGDLQYSKTSFVPSFNDLSMFDERLIKTITDPIRKGSRINLYFANSEKESLLLILRDGCGVDYYAKVKYLPESDIYEVVDISGDIPSGQYLITSSSKKSVYSSQLTIEFSR
jgi:hypothetical protein